MTEQMLEDIDGNLFPSTMKYYQPDLSKEWDVIGGNSSLHSFQVFRSKEIAQKAFPSSVILEFSGSDIEKPMFSDRLFETASE